MAQTGNSCSNPYVMNLTNGIGNAEFQFHYPDTVMYVAVYGIQNKHNFDLLIDTNANMSINRITIKNKNCTSNSLFDSEVSSNGNFVKLTSMNFANNDSILLIIDKNQYNIACNFCDTSNMNIKFSVLVPGPNTCVVSTEYCDNLVINGDLEEFQPQFEPGNNPNQGYQNQGVYILPDWGERWMDEGVTCGWDPEWYDQGPGANPQFVEWSARYINEWFDNSSNQALCTPFQSFATQALCNTVPHYGFNPIYCNPEPQQVNDFFPSTSGVNNNGYMNSWDGLPSRLTRGNIISLQPSTLYYFEVNIAAPNAGTYGAVMNFDVSTDLNYNQSSYQGGLPAANIELTVNGFDYDPNQIWKKFNTVFNAVGGESKIYAGNLGHFASPIFTSSNPITTWCTPFNDGIYFFDNFVVKKFFADAGTSTLTACEGVGVQIQPSTCPFPNATYSWTPAIYFDNPTSPNPTFTAPSGTAGTIQVTLTVSINTNDGVLGNVVAHTASSTVDITVIQGSSITINGPTTVLTGGNTTLNLSNGTNFSWTGSDGSSGTSASISTGPLTQDVTYTINAISSAGCSVTEIVTVTVTQLPAACINDPNYPNTIIIPNGTDDALFLAMNLGVYTNSVYLVTSKNFALEGTLNFSSAMNVKFENCHFYCFDASEIINYGMLDLVRSKFEACNNMWKGIQNNFVLNVGSCTFKDAEYAIHLKHQSRYRITMTTFENNLYGILMGEIGQTSTITGYDNSNVFKNPLPLKQLYLNMQDWMPWSEAGIRIESINYVQIGQEITSSNPLSYTNKFHNINNGILITNTDVKVVNSMFFSITPLIQRTVPAFLKYDGSAIYAQSTFMPKKLMVNAIPNYSGHEFLNCTEGIKTNMVSLNAVKLSMNNVGSGVQCFNSVMCIHYVCENTINAIFRGIEISGAGFANSVNVNANIINITNSIAITGISVTATQLGIGSNVNIKFNEVTAGRTTMNGILTSKLSSPTLLCNTVKRVNNSSQYSQFIALNGYNISGCNGANLTTNSMEWLSAGSTANNGNDYVITSSPASELVCNNSGVSNVGFKVSSNCIDLTFRRNKIGSHAIGLYYDGTANSGSQPANPSAATEGNKWLGSYSIWGAWNYNTDFQMVQNSSYYYNISNTNINRPPNSSWHPNYWFDPSGSNFIQPDCASGACILNQIAKPGNTDYYRAIANGTITTVDYPVQSKWMAQSYLINRLGQDTTLRNSDDSLRYFYYAPESRTLKAINEIDARNNNYAATSKLISHSVFANDSLLNVISQNMTLQLSDTLMLDSVFYSLSADLQEQYAFINDINEGFSNDIFALLDENLNQAKEINDTLHITNANETILQTINDIYYRYHRSNYTKINEDDASMIAYIAHLCPLAAGPAVYQARDLYALLVDSVVYQDSSKCAMQGYVREELQVFEPKGAIQKMVPAYFKAFPVPSKQAVELQFTELNSEANLTVFNIQGQLMYQTTIPKGLSKFNLNIEEYSEGVYQVLLVNNEFSKRSKICKIK
jgi:hypothetical protein